MYTLALQDLRYSLYVMFCTGIHILMSNIYMAQIQLEPQLQHQMETKAHLNNNLAIL